MLRNSVLYSTILHVAVVTVGFFGLPHIRKPPPTLETPILVELVQDVAVTNLPTRRTPPPKKKVEKKPEPKKQEPKKEVKKAAPPPPKPKPKAAPPPPAAPKQEVVALPPPKPESKPKLKAKPKPKQKPKPVAKPKPVIKVPPQLARAKPRRKPKPPDPFASVLRTVEDIKHTPPPPKKEAEKKKPAPAKKRQPSFDEQIAKALSRQPREFDRKRMVGINYQERLIGSIKQQLKPCWIIAAGARDRGTLSVEIKVELAPDGNVLRSSAVNRARMVTDGFYRAAAEAALRAVSRESKCTPLRLPRDDYDLWRELVLNFNPAEALGK